MPDTRGKRRQRLAWFLLICAAACSVDGIHAAESPCLAEVRSAASGELGYRARASRCEGLLQLYVGNSDSIDLIGYHAAPVDFKAIAEHDGHVRVLGGGDRDKITLRALSVTQRSRYQMDMQGVRLGEPIDWPGDVLGKAMQPAGAAPLDPAKVGLLACSERCSDHPDTVYWPVLTGSSRSERSSLTLLLRAGVRATKVSMQLESLDGKRRIDVPTSALVLLPDSITPVTLPATMAPGRYKLVLEARDSTTRAPLGTFMGLLEVPSEGR